MDTTLSWQDNLTAGNMTVQVGTVSAITASHQITASLGTVTIVTDNTNKSGTTTVVANGLLAGVTFVTPDMEATNSTNFQLKDSNGYAIWTSGTVAESGTNTFNFGGTVVPLYGTTTIVAVAEGTQSAARAVPFVLKYMK